MELLPGVIKEDYSNCILYFIEILADELRKEIYNHLVEVCQGAAQSQSKSRIYSYKDMVKEHAGKKICVLTLTKALLMQAKERIQSVSKNFSNIVVHLEMYNFEDKSCLTILIQE